ncbi:acyl-CoA synthetase FdrA [Clostridium sp. MCC353]|uniref:DUF1116 domain-containing protein n=1 Tax=Clostridium sp. MCC353 TaxID=2592646 RepID=UPI001C02E77F|nr:DUF1116 domain-containing protein [Clostridium sp. MCC353]MBT9776777.1 acyl-CoA synthetase FdrA [Clostridium sp. MCC353]
MLFTVIKKNSYQDSVNLMLLTNRINTLPGVKRSSVMMGTEANMNIFRNTGFYTGDMDQAAPNDMVIVVDADLEETVGRVLEETEAFLGNLSAVRAKSGEQSAESWDEALELLPQANLAVFSIPGEYAADDLEEALGRGLHVFSFTDNVSLDDEVRLKKKAHEKGLLFMGPDCGTGIISGVPIAFTNVVGPGNIGIVGASGTGIQEVTTMIGRLGGGVIHAAGTGGRDLSREVGAVTMKDAILALEYHDPTDVIVIISKPPSKEVRDQVAELLQSVSKPVVAVFLGEKPDHHEGNVYLAHTLEEAARMAVDLSKGRPVKANYYEEPEENGDQVGEDQTVKGLYSGGTLAAEAGMMISEALNLGGLIKKDGYILQAGGYEVIDLGDDIYTQGKPHPMIDPEVRVRKMREYAAKPDTGVILLDCVLGYGCHPDMAGALAPVIRETMAQARAEGRKLYYVASVCGTGLDIQDYDKSVETLKSSGAIVEMSNARAVRVALKLKGLENREPDKAIVEWKGEKKLLPEPGDKIMELFNSKPRVINVGVEGFKESVRKHGGEAVQFSWKPAAGGNKHIIGLLGALKKHPEIDEMNDKVIKRLKDSQPFLTDVVPAETVIPELKGRTLLHAGPPISYKEMTGPMKGSCIGAVLFEGWAEEEEGARALLEEGQVNFLPCHHVGAVGPMGGITSGHMPLLVVNNRLDGTVAYCTLNEGIGKVLRFGAYSKEVVDRLCWMRDTLGPVLSLALKKCENGINLNVIIAKAITMGDEFHQRNIAASLIFMKEMTPLIMDTCAEEARKKEVIRFLADTDQFFLNIMMAAGKSMADCARKLKEGCVVTAMARNGVEFGIRISGMGDRWFTAPVNVPKGLYFSGYKEVDANPDMGDSAITETVGVGGMAMIAAPGVTRFVGAGGFGDALQVSEEMERICIGHNPNFTIPTWDFKGSLLGIDIRKVAATGITPLINTGIAHKNAGAGQIGAGTVRAPLACFEKALEAYAGYLDGSEEG